MNVSANIARSCLHRVGMLLLSLCLAMSLMPAVAWADSASAVSDVSWYTSDTQADTFYIDSIEDLAGLSDLVNGTAVDQSGAAIPAQTFAGKTVVLGQNINGRAKAIQPIGGQGGASFDGIFNGNGNTIDNLVIDASSNENIGIFGKTGAGSLLENVSLGRSVSISIAIDGEEGPIISNVGLLVGYSEGSLEGCSVAGTVTIQSAVKQWSEDACVVVEKVGGVAGVCYYDVANCTFTGTLSITASAAPTAEYDTPELVAMVGGIVGFEGDLAQYQSTSTTDSHGSITGCTNAGTILIETPSDAGTDRFGEVVAAQSTQVGGVAGYSRGSVVSCTNDGYVRAMNAEIAGGIVGSLRSVEAEGNANYSSTGGDEGSADDEIVASQCVNNDTVYARAGVGGIAGQSGTYVTLEGCINAADAFVVATRWNKPAPGGIVGRAYGTVRYCANLGSVASGTWDNEELRTLKTMSGYYAAGIAGMILHYTSTDEAGNTVRTSPVSEVYNCYNAGPIIVQSGFRSRNIVGNNEGYVHDNAALSGVCDQDQCTYGELEESDAAGIAENNLVCAAISGYSQTAEKSLAGDGIMTYKYRVLKDGEEAWETGTKESSLVHLNSLASANGFSVYWICNSDASINKGYPMLNWQAEKASVSTTDLSAASLTLSENAKYNGGEAIPKVSVTLAGKTLIQNVDYQVIPESGAVAVSQGTPYKATVKGIGLYSGVSSASVAYGIDKGDLSSCSAVIDSKVFNWEAQQPDVVIVKDASGNVVPDGEYTFALQEEAVNAGLHSVLITAKSDSELFEGSLDATFRIEAADFKSKVGLEENGTKIVYLGNEYGWCSQLNSVTETDPAKIPFFEYTGHPIQPEVTNVTYLGKPLVEGRDYNVIYGDLGNSESGTAVINVSKDNIGSEGDTVYGAITIRYVIGSNFANYDNMLIKIADTGAKLSLSDAVVDAPTVIYENQPMRTVSLSYGGAALEEGVDYEIAYENNDGPGTARYTVTGMGKYEGTLTGTFEITDDALFDFTFDVVDEGSSKSASITGFKYNGIFDTFDLVIPSTVEKDGQEYPVMSIAANAFGGEKASDFAGTDKLRIKAVWIPASVTSIGAYAFGSASTSAEPTVTSVTFEEGSKLASIGEGAFKRCKSLTSFTFPEGVASIGAKAFDTCTALTTLVFETKEATLPSSIASDSFLAVGGVTRPVRVMGYETALAVKQFAQDNSTKATVGVGANGGKNFSFVSLAGDIASATVSYSAAVEYTGAPIEPPMVLELDGKTLVEGVDYSVAYSDNVDVGTASATITALGSYRGETQVFFEITPVSLSGARVALAASAFQGDPVEPDVTVTCNGKTLVEGVDFEVASIVDNDKPGSYATVAIRGLGNYAGTQQGQFRVLSYAADLFPDVVSDPDYYEWYVTGGYIDYSYSRGLITGFTDTGLYGPYENITRGQVATILWRIEGQPQVSASVPAFPDVDYAQYYGDAIRWARSTGVITGYETGSVATTEFRPDNSVSRQELMTMIARYATMHLGTELASDCSMLDAMPDAESVASWARVSVGWCMDHGIVSGVDYYVGNSIVSYVEPEETAYRAAMAKMSAVLYRDVLMLD